MARPLRQAELASVVSIVCIVFIWQHCRNRVCLFNFEVMKVIDLIIQLQQMPANKEIVVEKGNGKMFCFADIVSVEEIEIDEIGEVVAILPFSMDNKDNSN